MAVAPVEVTLELTPRARFDIIDVRERLRGTHGDVLDVYPRHLYHSFHTTAGYLEQSLATRSRRRLTSIVGFTRERQVARLRIDVPVSDHQVDSVNLKDPKLGIYEQIVAMVRQQGVSSGRVRLELAGAERQAGLTLNEYETPLMRHGLAD